MSISNILFVDIETCRPQEYLVHDTRNGELFMKRFKSHWNNVDKQWDEIYNENAPFSAEFGKICNISIGQMRGDTFYIKSVAGEDEVEILTQFCISLAKSEATRLCAHNGHEFDFPFIARRMWINKIAVPSIIDPFNKKPWEVSDKLYDTMKIWSGV